MYEIVRSSLTILINTCLNIHRLKFLARLEPNLDGFILLRPKSAFHKAFSIISGAETVVRAAFYKIMIQQRQPMTSAASGNV